MNDKVNPPRIENQGSGWAYTIDPSSAPQYVLVTMRGIAEDSMLSSCYQELAGLSEAYEKDGETFPVLIVDVLNLSRGATSLVTAWQLGALLAHRIDNLIILHTQGRDSVLDLFLTTLVGIAARIILCPNLEEALRTLRARPL